VRGEWGRTGRRTFYGGTWRRMGEKELPAAEAVEGLE